jgi:uncharacterized protein YndB with AHSA1/START domain
MNRTGTLSVIAGRNVLRFERRYPHPVDKVWRAITEPAHLSRWFPADMRMELQLGAKIRFVFREAEWDESDGEITALDPPRLFEFTWAGDVLRWELAPDGGGCLLVFHHTFEDRAGAASSASGWEGCLAGLDEVLGDTPPEQPHWAERHEEYVELFGLGEGTVLDQEGGHLVRFERQMTLPVDRIWAELCESAADTAIEVGGVPPVRVTNPYVAAGAVTTVEAPRLIEYEWTRDGAPAGRVRWELAPGTGGARLILTQSVPAAAPDERITALASWHTRLEIFAARLRGREVCPWPSHRTAELMKHYADLLR